MADSLSASAWGVRDTLAAADRTAPARAAGQEDALRLERFEALMLAGWSAPRAWTLAQRPLPPSRGGR